VSSAWLLARQRRGGLIPRSILYPIRSLRLSHDQGKTEAAFFSEAPGEFSLTIRCGFARRKSDHALLRFLQSTYEPRDCRGRSGRDALSASLASRRVLQILKTLVRTIRLDLGLR